MKQILIFVFLLMSAVGYTQYTPMTGFGYEFKYLKADSGLAIPYRDTTVGRGTVRPGSIVCRPADSLFYGWNGRYWSLVNSNISSVIALINQKVDSVVMYGDTMKYWKNGVSYGYVVPNIYNSDGQLTGNRNLDANNHDFTIDNFETMEMSTLGTGKVTINQDSVRVRSGQITFSSNNGVAQPANVIIENPAVETDTANVKPVAIGSNGKLYKYPSWPGAANNSWNITGNSGLDASTNYIGTNDDVDVVFKVNGSEVGRFGNVYNTALGDGNTASARGSFSTGTNSQSLGVGSFTSGASTANGDYSIAMGFGRSDSANGVALGAAYAANLYSVAIGGNASSYGWASTAIGYGAVSNSKYLFSAGRYNDISDAIDDTSKIFQIGNGYSWNKRSNILTATYSGIGIGTTAPDSTLHVVGGLKFVTGRQGAGKVLTSNASGGADWAAPDTASLSNRINTKLNISDTSNMRARLIGGTNITLSGTYPNITINGTSSGGTVTSVATGYGLSGGTITTTGTLIVDSATLSTKYLRRADSVAGGFYPYTTNPKGYLTTAVTSVATGLGLSGGTITTTGTIALDTSNASVLSRQRAALTYEPLSDTSKSWDRTGNIAVSGSSLLGTLNNVSLRLISNGSTRMTIDSVGSVGIGTTASASALMELSSTTKGLIIPSMTKTQRDAISSPAQGLLVYNTTLKAYDFYSTIGSASYWTTIGSGCKYGVAIGNNALQSYTGTGDAYNVGIGYSALGTASSSLQCVAIGGYCLALATGSQNTAVGYSSGSSISSGTNNAAFGFSAAQYLTTESNRLVLNSIGRTNKAGDTTQSIIYGYQNATVNNNQYLKINGSLVVNSSGSAVARPDNSAIVDLSSNTTKGFLPPVLTTTQRDAITSPAAGLMIYNTTTGFIDYYNGTAWKELQVQ